MRLKALVSAIGALSLLAEPSLASQAVRPVVAATTTAQPAAAPARALTAPDLDAWLDGYMATRLERNDVAGAMVVVVKNGSILFSKGYGYADVARRVPVDPDTSLFRPGSVSKLMTWTAVMQQVELGHIDLDRDINAYLDFKIPPFRGRPITMRNLLTHTPGFQESLKDLLLFDPKGRMPLADYLKRQIPPRVYEPGQVPSYSNYGAALAGYIVQRVSGQPYEDYVEQHIFGPLGMQNSSFREPLSARLQARMAQSYEVASGSPMAYEMFPAPAGSAALTGSDMARFMIAHLDQGEYLGQRMLKPETARMMHDTPLTTISPALNRMLLGFWETRRNGHRIIGHDGDTLYFHSVLRLLPDDDVGLFISVNSIGKDNGGRKIRDDLIAGLIDRYFPGPTITGKVSADVARRDGQLLAGSYSSALRWQIGYASLLDLGTQTVVTADGMGRITASSILGPNGQPRQFEEIAPFVWREIGGKSLIAAKVTDGKVAMWADDENAPIGAFLPTPAARDSAWLVPMLVLSLTALLLMALLWPITALVRRRYAAPLAVPAAAARSRWWVHVGASTALVLMLAWLATLGWIVTTFTFTAALDPWIRVLQLLSCVVFPAAALIALRNVWTVCITRKGWRSAPAWAWSVIVAVSCLTLLYVALAFDLIGFSLAL